MKANSKKAAYRPFEEVASQVEVGHPVPFAVYGQDGQKLIAQGTVVPSEKLRQRLLTSGVYAEHVDTSKEGAPLDDGEQQPSEFIESDEELKGYFQTVPRADRRFRNPIADLGRAKISIERALMRFEEDPGSSVASVKRMAYFLDDLMSMDMDAVIGSIQLERVEPLSYPLHHAMRCSLFTGLIARLLERSRSERVNLVSAACTANLTIFELQQRLEQYAGTLDEQTRAQIQEHPRVTAHYLEQAGVTSDDWLEAVRSHHERLDGSGYPQGRQAHEIPFSARVLAIAESVAAATTPRGFREHSTIAQVLRELSRRGHAYDEQLIQQILTKAGPLWPGTLVSLKDGRVALITRRTRSPRIYQAALLYDERGRRTWHPQRLELQFSDIRSVHALTETSNYYSAAILWDVD